MKKKYFLSVLVFVFLQFTGFIHGAIPSPEREALIALYNSTNGDGWYFNYGWKIPPLHTDGFAMPGTEIFWQGVGVLGTHVDTLLLSNYNLIGCLPSQLGNLSQVKTVSLSYNQLSGIIPSQLGNLNQLVYLDLSNNQLSCTIPTSLMNATRLTILDIDYNCLSTTDPTLIAWLNKRNRNWNAHQDQCVCSVTAPTVTTNSVSSITSNSAVCGGNVTLDGGSTVTTRGVCWSTSSNPTTANSKTTNGSGTGSFTSNISGLNPSTPYYVRAYATNSMGTSYGSSRSFTTEGMGQPKISINRSKLNYGAIGNKITGSQAISVSNSGNGTLNWSASSNAGWLNITPLSGSNSGTITATVNPTGLNAGTYSSKITVTDSNASNSPQLVSVNFKVYGSGQSTSPFGDFSTPVAGSTVSSSIAVTGWALDDIGVQNVKIYRAEGNTKVFIGDAIFVEGARPDVEIAYPNYPFKYKAGWGYMLLTNFLPNGGNGTYNLYAKTSDKEGNEVTLGSKTIYCDNANAENPFGAIDTPSQGGNASGKKYMNYGWVLTPTPNYIPTNGSTISVFVDGVNLGHPLYNLYRSDIANLFPGYYNTNGAVGYFDIDTTNYSNGLHSIFWVATDSAGNSDGIGSRYFMSQNSVSSGSTSASMEKRFTSGHTDLIDIPVSFDGPVKLIKGYTESDIPVELTPDSDGTVHIQCREMERIEVQVSLAGNEVEGYMIVGNRLMELPIGSTLDKITGRFSWIPGPGFIGTYRIVFIETGREGEKNRKNIMVSILPKFSGE